MRPFNKIAIIGVGLIGGSLGLKIKEKKLARRVIGIGHHEKSIKEALRLKAIDEGALSLAKVKDAELVILAIPVSAIISILPKLSGLISKDCIVIDVGSTKGKIISVAKGLAIDFIGCHPLAGLETRGVRNAKSSLFENSLCLLVPLSKTKKKSLLRVQQFWEEMGAKTKPMAAGEHDRILSFISHLPHALASSLMNCIDPKYLSYAAGGLKDMTRIALSEPALWRDIFLTNKRELISSIERFKTSLSAFESFIKRDQPHKLSAYLKKSRDRRNGF